MNESALRGRSCRKHSRRRRSTASTQLTSLRAESLRASPHWRHQLSDFLPCRARFSIGALPYSRGLTRPLLQAAGLVQSTMSSSATHSNKLHEQATAKVVAV